MRKFRAWYNGKMIGWEQLVHNENMNLFPNLFHLLLREDVIDMQFTGKQCLNREGVLTDIYEGDIFEFDRQEWGGDNNIHVVEWDEHNAEWCFGGGSVNDMEWRTLIGNIYENPELIQKP